MAQLGFGGGCHWCTEAVFQPLIGVADVRQGFIRSDAPNDAWSEAVEVEFDPEQIKLRDLVAVHLITHASQSRHKMRGKYRSAIYVHDEAMREACRALIGELEKDTSSRFVTSVLMHRAFKHSDARFRNYYKSGPDRPFCQAYIKPKLSKLRTDYHALIKQEEKTI